MKAEITKEGKMRIISETEPEIYALNKWAIDNLSFVICFEGGEKIEFDLSEENIKKYTNES